VARRVVGRRGFAPRTARLTAWGLGPEGALAHSSSVAQGFATGIVPTSEGFTIVRIRGEFLAFLQSAGSNGDGFQGAVGIGLASDEAFAVGITALPTPLSDDEDELWIWHSFFNIFAGTAATGSREPAATVRLPVDTKAMRKFPVGTTMFAAVEVVETGVAVGSSKLLTRMLFKLP